MCCFISEPKLCAQIVISHFPFQASWLICPILVNRFPNPAIQCQKTKKPAQPKTKKEAICKFVTISHANVMPLAAAIPTPPWVLS